MAFGSWYENFGFIFLGVSDLQGVKFPFSHWLFWSSLNSADATTQPVMAAAPWRTYVYNGAYGQSTSGLRWQSPCSWSGGLEAFSFWMSNESNKICQANCVWQNVFTFNSFVFLWQWGLHQLPGYHSYFSPKIEPWYMIVLTSVFGAMNVLATVS